MNRLLKSALLFVLWAILSTGCNRNDRPMPLTKKNAANYMQKVDAAIKSANPNELQEAKGNTDVQKKLFYKSFVEPMETMGYSYDKTIGDIGNKLLARSLQTTDTATTVMISDMLTFAKHSREAAFKFGFISKETKEILEKVSLIFPR